MYWLVLKKINKHLVGYQSTKLITGLVSQLSIMHKGQLSNTHLGETPVILPRYGK